MLHRPKGLYRARACTHLLTWCCPTLSPTSYVQLVFLLLLQFVPSVRSSPCRSAQNGQAGFSIGAWLENIQLTNEQQVGVG